MQRPEVWEGLAPPAALALDKILYLRECSTITRRDAPLRTPVRFTIYIRISWHLPRGFH